MKKPTFKSICRNALLAAAICAVCFGFTQLDDRRSVIPSAEIVEWNSGDIPSRVALGEEVSLPESVDVVYDGKNYTANDGVVEYPDGRLVETDGKLSLNESGVYTIKYFFEAENKNCIAEKKVTVYNDYFDFTVDNGSAIVVSDDENTLWSGKDGLIVDLKEGAEFVYNKPVDLRKAGSDGLTSVIELDSRLGSFSDEKYIPDAEVTWVKLTDCYNPNLTVELRMGRSVDYSGSLFTGVKSTYQDCTGLDPEGRLVENLNRLVTIDGVNYKLWPNEEGYANENLPNMESPMSSGIVWKYDYEQMRFYIEWTGPYGSYKKLITDLDDSAIYNKGNLFPGWTTGEVYISVYTENYSKASARNEIISIGGEAAKSLFTDNQYVDGVAPEIAINAKKTTDTGIMGAVGETVVIPEATATDVNLVGEIEVSVYRGYGTEYVSNVSVIDNSFVLSRNDLYTIVYTAKDGAGNVAVETFTVAAVSTAENRSVTLIADELKRLNAGEAVFLDYTVKESLNTSISDVDVTINVKSERESFVLKGAGEFMPRYAGEYEIVYEYSDGIFTYEKSYRVTCRVSSVVSFCDEILLPRYFVKGFTYAIDGITAYSYWRDEPTEAPTDAYVVYDDGNEQKIDNLNRVTITGEESARFVFKSGDATKTSDTVKIVDVEYAENKIDMGKLFVGNFDVNAESNGKRTQDITFTSKATTGDNTLSFVNPVSYRNFNLTYKINSGYGNFTALNIILTDKIDSSKTYTIGITNNGGSANLSLNGGVSASLGTDYKFVGEASHSIGYDYATRKLTLDKKIFTANIDLPSGECYIDIQMQGINGESAIKISKINQQQISGLVFSDKTSPEIYIDDAQGEYGLGETVTLKVPEFSDVLSGVDYSTVTFTIYCGDGKPAKDVDGNDLTDLKWNEVYRLSLDRITTYNVDYTVKDFAGCTAYGGYLINCVDTTAPIIDLDNIKDGETIRIKAGGEVKIAFTVSDDITPPVELQAYIHLYCEDMFQFVANVGGFKNDDRPIDGKYNGTFNIPVKGAYTAQIHVYDKAGNHARKDVKIIVE